jgi:hypothetical protein
MLLIAFCSSRADELPSSGEAFDAGDSYALKDGFRVELHRVVNEVANKLNGTRRWGALGKVPVHPFSF